MWAIEKGKLSVFKSTFVPIKKEEGAQTIIQKLLNNGSVVGGRVIAWFSFTGKSSQVYFATTLQAQNAGGKQQKTSRSPKSAATRRERVERSWENCPVVILFSHMLLYDNV